MNDKKITKENVNNFIELYNKIFNKMAEIHKIPKLFYNPDTFTNGYFDINVDLDDGVIQGVYTEYNYGGNEEIHNFEVKYEDLTKSIEYFKGYYSEQIKLDKENKEKRKKKNNDEILRNVEYHKKKYEEALERANRLTN